MNLDVRKEIRKHYSKLTDSILERSEIKNSFWVDPYCDIDWCGFMTPIEFNMWTEIRHFGHAPFYPQYPVGKYFLDFGNPSTKVGIECDGEEFHKDKEKDRKRDKWLSDNGWIIYRISGADCVKDTKDIDLDMSEEERSEAVMYNYMNTCLGLVKSIGIYHFNFNPFYPQLEQMHFAAECLLRRLSIKTQFHQVLLDRRMQNYYQEQDKTVY